VGAPGLADFNEQLARQLCCGFHRFGSGVVEIGVGQSTQLIRQQKITEGFRRL